MQMPVIVGILVAVIFLIAFSEWFYHLITGWKEIVLDDIYFLYRIAGVSLLSIFIMSATFYGMALFNECDKETREGVFAKLNCEEFSKIKAEAKVLIRAEEPTE